MELDREFEQVETKWLKKTVDQVSTCINIKKEEYPLLSGLNLYMTSSRWLSHSFGMDVEKGSHPVDIEDIFTP